MKVKVNIRKFPQVECQKNPENIDEEHQIILCEIVNGTFCL